MNRLIGLVGGVAVAVMMAGAANAQTSARTTTTATTHPSTTATPSGVAPVQPYQPGQEQPISQTAARYSQNTGNEPDVFLDVPNLSVESIDIQVDKLQVHLALDAQLGSMLKLAAGADASVDKVKITIKGVKATAQLKVRLDNVAAILDRTLTTIDRNPQLIARALGTVDNAVNNVSGVANNAVSTVGGVANNAIRPAAGSTSVPAQPQSQPQQPDGKQ